MRVHHLNCGTMCPLGGRYMDGFSKGISSTLSCHCLLIESDQGLVLVDTGFGVPDMIHPKMRLSPFFLRLNRIQLDKEQTALRNIERLGFKKEDVRHIILTHLDFDHAGGISDFPFAQVHLLQSELHAAQNPNSWLAKQRYRHEQWDFERSWVPYSAQGEPWFGFDSVRDLRGLPPEILLVPLVGHTHGHCGVAVQSDQGWLLHAGDAYFFRGEMDPQKYHCTPGLRIYQRMMEVDRKARLSNQRKLRDLIKNQGDKVRIFSSHDQIEFDCFHRLSKESHRHSERPEQPPGPKPRAATYPTHELHP